MSYADTVLSPKVGTIRVSKIWVGPVGNVSRGHVLDCSVEGITRALKDHDKQLYVKWNPKKLKGYGCWEVRRHPNFKTIRDVAVIGDSYFLQMDYVENNLVHHVLDCAFLNYDAVRYVKFIDTTNEKHLIHDLEYNEKTYNDKIQDAANKEMQYNLKQMRSLGGQLKEMVASGLNPARIADTWGHE